MVLSAYSSGRFAASLVRCLAPPGRYGLMAPCARHPIVCTGWAAVALVSALEVSGRPQATMGWREASMLRTSMRDRLERSRDWEVWPAAWVWVAGPSCRTVLRVAHAAGWLCELAFCSVFGAAVTGGSTRVDCQLRCPDKPAPLDRTTRMALMKFSLTLKPLLLLLGTACGPCGRRCREQP